MLNKVKEKLAKGEVTKGIWLGDVNESIAATMASTDLDWLLLDGEHGAINIETLDRLIQAIGGNGALPIVRVVWNDMNVIKQVLDAGAYGIVVPWVNTAKEAEQVVLYTRYMPEGLRGCMPARAAKVWGITSAEYLEKANDNIVIAVQIETKEAVENIEEIVQVEGIDTTFIGPGDLSASLGVRGQSWHPEVVKAIEHVLEVCNKSKVAPGIAFGKNDEHCKELIEKGFRFIGIGGTNGFLLKGVRDTLAKY